jgi:hypothetical protein
MYIKNKNVKISIILIIFMLICSTSVLSIGLNSTRILEILYNRPEKVSYTSIPIKQEYTTENFCILVETFDLESLYQNIPYKYYCDSYKIKKYTCKLLTYNDCIGGVSKDGYYCYTDKLLKTSLLCKYGWTLNNYDIKSGIIGVIS